MIEQLHYLGPDHLQWREAPLPRLTTPRSALVRPVAVATGDLDGLIIAGQSPFPAPFPLGHECVAQVVDIGAQVTTVTAGDMVSVPFQISCGTCAKCVSGRTANCTGVPPLSTYGFGPEVGRWGGFLSDLVEVPFAEHMLVKVPDLLDPAAVASASDNVADGWRAVGPPLAAEPGAPVLVVGGGGPGSIGLYAAALAIALGSERVTYLDADERRRTVAEGLGAITQPPPFPVRLGPFPITVDASADPDGLRLALLSTGPDGICTGTSIYFGEQPSLPLLQMYTKGITFKTGRVHGRPAIPDVLMLAASGKFNPARITTRVVSWPDAAQALIERDWTKLVIER